MAKKIRKRIKNNTHIESFYKKYNFEILVLGLLTLGFFLLWEKWKIKTIFWNFVTSIANFIVVTIRNIAVKFGNVISKVETSDIIGIALILVAFLLILNRTRMRIIRSHPNLISCPKCKGGLHRSHRKTKHKILAVFLLCVIKRYKCRKCSFDGVAMGEGGVNRHS